MEYGILFIAFVLGVFVYVAIAKTTFKVETMARNTKAQTRLLMLIAEQSGVSNDKIKEAISGRNEIMVASHRNSSSNEVDL